MKPESAARSVFNEYVSSAIRLPDYIARRKASELAISLYGSGRLSVAQLKGIIGCLMFPDARDAKEALSFLE